MAQYNFKINHQKGSENAKTDALSQKEDYMRSVLKTKDTILQQNQFGDMEYNHQVAAILQTDNHDFEKKVKEALA